MLIKLAVVGLSAALVAQSAAAREPQPDPDARSVTVSYADLDLSRHAGTDVLMQRIHRASEQVCGPAPVAADLGRGFAYRSCITETTRQAVASVGSVMVTALASGSAHSTQIAEGDGTGH